MYRSDENKEKYQLRDYQLIQYQIVIMRIVKQSVRIITNKILGGKGFVKADSTDNYVFSFKIMKCQCGVFPTSQVYIASRIGISRNLLF